MSRIYRALKIGMAALAVLGASVSCTPPTVPTTSASSFQMSPLRRFSVQTGTTLSNGKQLLSTNGNTYIANVPFVQQGQDNTCGQAAMTMVLQFWGVDIDYQTVVNEGNPFNLATSFDAMQNFLTSKGLSVQGYREGSLETLLLQIHKGQPVIVLLNFGSITTPHYVVVTGYNAQRNTIIMHESQSGPYVELPLDQFLDMWENDPIVNLPLFGGENYRRLMFEVKGQVTTE